MAQCARIGVGSQPQDLLSRCPVPDRQLAGVVIRWYAHAVSHKGLGLPRGRATGSVNPLPLEAAWYRQFSGAGRLARGGKNSPLEIFQCALILMGDWCGPASDTA